jgi:fucose permease
MVETLVRPRVWLNVALFFAYCGLEASAGSWAYTFLTESRGVSRVPAGLCVSAYWGALTVGRILFGQASARLSPHVLLRGVSLVVPIATLLIWLNPMGRGDVLGFVLLGFALAPIFPMLISITPEQVGGRFAHHAIGFQVSAASLGVACFPAVAGVLARRFGLDLIGEYLVVIALLLFALLELSARIDARMPSAAGPSFREVGVQEA